MVCICGSLAAFGCKAKRQTVAGPKPATRGPDKSLSKLDAIRSSQLSYTTFSGKAKTKLDINGSGNDVTLNIRIQSGKKIWISVTAIAGIEVARALITPDSLLVINKLQGLYLQKPFSYIYSYTSQQINFDSLEALLVGNAIPQLLNNDAKLQADSVRTVMWGNLQQLAFKLILGADLKANHTELTDPYADQSLTVDNSAFIPVANRVFSSQIDLASVMPKKRVKMTLHYNKADFDQPLEYPFSIPSGYSPAK
jgi:hypothetical protein